LARDRLLELEAEFWEAAGDPDFYRANFADDGLMASPVGVMTKPDFVAAMDGATKWESFTIVYINRGGDWMLVLHQQTPV
jgi:hypothetical protein